MKLYTYDTEFLEDGKTIDLISIGIVGEDGREYYAINSDADWDRIRKDDWLMEHVVSSLPTHSTGQVQKRRAFGDTGFSWGGLDMKSTLVKPKWVIANEVREFLVGGLTPAGERDGRPFYFDTDMPELWADYAAYDHVALAQLWGKMISLPKGIPMFTNDIEQEIRRVPGFEKPRQAEGEHNALADARHNMVVLRALEVLS